MGKYNTNESSHIKIFYIAKKDLYNDLLLWRLEHANVRIVFKLKDTSKSAKIACS